MTAIAQRIVRQALTLPARTRAGVALRLIESLETPREPDRQYDELWEAEIGRRLEEVETGRVRPLTPAEVRKALRQRRR